MSSGIRWLCADEILVALFLDELRKNVLEDVVQTTARPSPSDHY
jgi:hypothetical protein